MNGQSPTQLNKCNNVSGQRRCEKGRERQATKDRHACRQAEIERHADRHAKIDR